jgi:F0F1-type ATP synthase assembly protein I
MAKTADKVAKTQTSLFITMALDMSWRLAIAVLVPIIGGFELDKKLDTSPLYMILGFALAMLGMGLVFWRTLQEASHLPVAKKEDKV